MTETRRFATVARATDRIGSEGKDVKLHILYSIIEYHMRILSVRLSLCLSICPSIRLLNA